MQKFFKQTREMEADTIQKNGASPKSRKMKGFNFKVFAMLFFMLSTFVFAGCEKEKETGDESEQTPPPIINTDDYANANVLLPKDWNGKFVLVNSWEWIWCQDCFDDYGILDNDPTYYKYPLSPNVVIEAGLYEYEEDHPFYTTRKMTVNEFADYMRTLGYGVEGEDCAIGIVANVIYENKMITEILEMYVP
ncbi:MAG: hypothetical protein LBH32_07675 [Dysgonamonadaceae bacterium]|nr:hypothetical protein [Dysgonamonadaceae bacterium]